MKTNELLKMLSNFLEGAEFNANEIVKYFPFQLLLQT